MCQHLKKNITLISENGEEATLSYYIIENENGSFGIKVSKTRSDDKKIESSKMNNFSYHKIEVESILERLIEGKVTPISLEDVLLDLLEKKKIELAQIYPFPLNDLV